MFVYLLVAFEVWIVVFLTVVADNGRCEGLYFVNVGGFEVEQLALGQLGVQRLQLIVN